MPSTNVSERRWFPSHQPQTLQIAVALLYWNAALSLISFLFVSGLSRLVLAALIVAEVAGGIGVANERKWGYKTAVVASLLPFVLLALGYVGGGLLTLLFEVALIALLLHNQSRAYYKIWFR